MLLFKYQIDFFLNFAYFLKQMEIVIITWFILSIIVGITVLLKRDLFIFPSVPKISPVSSVSTESKIETNIQEVQETENVLPPVIAFEDISVQNTNIENLEVQPLICNEQIVITQTTTTFIDQFRQSLQQSIRDFNVSITSKTILKLSSYLYGSQKSFQRL
jgi:hypothetical protein